MCLLPGAYASNVNTPRTGRCRRYPALKEVVLNQVSFGEDEFKVSSPPTTGYCRDVRA
jgi:hypothetical protein